MGDWPRLKRRAFYRSKALPCPRQKRGVAKLASVLANATG